MLTGHNVGGYYLEQRIGSGSMGIVYQAQHLGLGHRVAIKFLRDEMSRDPRVVQSFINEAKVCANINHPNIVRVTDAKQDERGRAYLVMELLRGETLKERLEKGRPPTSQVESIMRGVLKGLAAAHRARVVHRDIKPANIFLCEDGGVKILDFGIARIDGGTTVRSGLNFTGGEAGTAAYMSPEQILGNEASPRSDLYSLGLVCYEMLTGQPAVSGDNEAAIGYAHVHKTLPSLSAELPKGLRQLVARATRKKPEERFQSAGEMLAVLDGAHPPRSVRDFFLEMNAPVWGIGTAALILVVGSMWGFSGERGEPQKSHVPAAYPVVTNTPGISVTQTVETLPEHGAAELPKRAPPEEVMDLARRIEEYRQSYEPGMKKLANYNETMRHRKLYPGEAKEGTAIKERCNKQTRALQSVVLRTLLKYPDDHDVWKQGAILGSIWLRPNQTGLFEIDTLSSELIESLLDSPIAKRNYREDHQLLRDLKSLK